MVTEKYVMLETRQQENPFTVQQTSVHTAACLWLGILITAQMAYLQEHIRSISAWIYAKKGNDIAKKIPENTEQHFIWIVHIFEVRIDMYCGRKKYCRHFFKTAEIKKALIFYI